MDKYVSLQIKRKRIDQDRRKLSSRTYKRAPFRYPKVPQDTLRYFLFLQHKKEPFWTLFYYFIKPIFLYLV